MTLSKRAYYGHGQLVSTGVDFTIHPQHGRIWTVDATATGLDISVAPATEFPYTGYAVLFIVNVGSLAFDIRDADGGLIAALPSGDCAKLGLGDNTTSAGIWAANIFTPNSAAAVIPAVHVVIGGNSSDPGNDDVEYYDVDLDSWTTGTDIGASGVEPCAGASSAKAYSRQQINDFREYVIDTWTVKTSASTLHTGLFGCMELNNTFHWFGRGLAAGPYQPEQWDQTDTWTSKTGPSSVTIVRHSATETGPDDGDAGWLYMGSCLAGQTLNFYQEYSQASDSYSDRTEISGTNGGSVSNDLENATLYAQEGTQIHLVGGDSGSGGTNRHDEYSIAGDSWAAETNYPGGSAHGIASNRYSDSDVLALLALNNVGSSSAVYRWNNSSSSYTALTSIGIYRASCNNAMSLLER